jgi:hypothetical protein
VFVGVTVPIPALPFNGKVFVPNKGKALSCPKTLATKNVAKKSKVNFLMVLII